MIPHLNTIKNRADKSRYSGTKLPYKLDNPYDNLMNYFGEKSLHILKYLNFTPNTLTLIGGIFMIFSIIFIPL